MTILNLPSVMRLCDEYFNTNIFKLNCKMSRSIYSDWPKKLSRLDKPFFHSISLNSQKYPQNRGYTVSLVNCFVLWVWTLKLTLYVHIKYSVASKRLHPLYSAVYLNGLRLFVFELCHDY